MTDGVTKIILVGNSTAAEILYQYLQRDSRYQVVAFSVEQSFITDEQYLGLPVVALEQLGDKFDSAEHQVLVAVGYNQLNQTRARLFEQVKTLGFNVLSYIHPDAKVYSDQIGEGAIIMANAVVEVCASVGDNSVVWANCVIGHHTQVAQHCWIASGSVLAGSASVGNYCFIGVNATVANQVNVAANNIVGANCAILKSTQDNQVYLAGQGEKIRFNATDYAEHFLK